MYEIDQSSGGPVLTLEHKISQDVVQRMVNVAAFDLGSVSIRVSTPRAEVTIELCMKDDKNQQFVPNPISGFPRELGVEEDLQRRSRMKLC